MLRIPIIHANVLVLHGPVPHESQYRVVYDFILDQFKRLGIRRPTSAFAPTELGNEPVYYWREWEKRINSRGFPTSIDWIRVDKEYPLIDGSTKVAGSFGTGERGFTFGFDHFVKGFDRRYFRKIAEALFDIYAFEYGYCLTRARSDKPWMYAHGNIVGLKELYSFSDTGVRWSNHLGEADSLRTSLRDVYPVNFITQDHLALPMKNGTVGDWITSDASRGTIEALNDDIFVWDVKDRHIDTIRDAMKAENLLVSYREE